MQVRDENSQEVGRRDYGPKVPPFTIKATAPAEEVAAAVASGRPLVVTGTQEEIAGFAVDGVEVVSERKPGIYLSDTPQVEVARTLTPAEYAREELPVVPVPKEGVVLLLTTRPVLLVWEES